MGKKMKKILIFVLISLIGVTSVFSQSFLNKLSKRNAKPIWIDYAIFNTDNPKLFRLEVYYQFYNAALNFQKENGDYVAEYEVVLDVLGKDDDAVGAYNHVNKIKVNSLARTKSLTDYRTNQVNFVLPEGKYEILLDLLDLNTQFEQSTSVKLKIKKNKSNHPNLSKIELVQGAQKASEGGSIFTKGDFDLIPSLTHQYGSDDDPRLQFYFEIYQGKKPRDSVVVEVSLRHFFRANQYKDTMTVFFEGKDKINQYREIKMELLPPGEYELIVRLMGKRKRRLSIVSKDFKLTWSQKAILKHDFNGVISQIDLIANRSEIKLLKKAITYEEKIEAYNSFWERRDPTPGTTTNESQREFYRRIKIANQYFTHLNRPGWKSDRGRIYISYGQPDQLEDFPISFETIPYQIWYYYVGERYKEFRFIDQNNDGNYWLVSPYDGLIDPTESDFYHEDDD
jgi:GWxTD domain-containing protein